jgi:plasmid stabilization system protein ParE
MVPVTFSPKSRQDLLDIGDYIAKDSRANARRFVGKPIDHYVIFFRVLDGTVRIERVLHGARNLPMLFGEADNVRIPAKVDSRSDANWTPAPA